MDGSDAAALCDLGNYCAAQAEWCQLAVDGAKRAAAAAPTHSQAELCAPTPRPALPVLPATREEQQSIAAAVNSEQPRPQQDSIDELLDAVLAGRDISAGAAQRLAEEAQQSGVEARRVVLALAQKLRETQQALDIAAQERDRLRKQCAEQSAHILEIRATK